MQHFSFPVMISHEISILNCLINLEFSDSVPVLALRQGLHLKERRKCFLCLFVFSFKHSLQGKSMKLERFVTYVALRKMGH